MGLFRVHVDAAVLIRLALAALLDQGTEELFVLFAQVRANLQIAVMDGIDERFAKGHRHANQAILVAELHAREIVF